jgi:DUF971 family protein
MANPIPTGITADREKKMMQVAWDDGETCELPFALLRNACPCAECRGGHENMRSEPDPEVFELPLIDARTTRLRRLELVGNYALTLEWEDGHHFGIYNWRYLRSLCDQAQSMDQSP